MKTSKQPTPRQSPKMKKMTSKHDFHTFPTEKGIFVSIHQEDELREDFGPFPSQRVANSAAHNEWTRQLEESMKNRLAKMGFADEFLKNNLIVM